MFHFLPEAVCNQSEGTFSSSHERVSQWRGRVVAAQTSFHTFGFVLSGTTVTLWVMTSLFSTDVAGRGSLGEILMGRWTLHLACTTAVTQATARPALKPPCRGQPSTGAAGQGEEGGRAGTLCWQPSRPLAGIIYPFWLSPGAGSLPPPSSLSADDSASNLAEEMEALERDHPSLPQMNSSS